MTLVTCARHNPAHDGVHEHRYSCKYPTFVRPAPAQENVDKVSSRSTGDRLNEAVALLVRAKDHVNAASPTWLAIAEFLSELEEEAHG